MDVKDTWWVTVDWTDLGMQTVLRCQIKRGILCTRWWTFRLNESQQIYCFAEQLLASSAGLWSRSSDFTIKFWATFSLGVLSKKNFANLVMSAAPSVFNDALWHWTFGTLNNVPNLGKNRLKITETAWRTEQNCAFVVNMGRGRVLCEVRTEA